jgi:hypothetical protein
MKGLGLQSQLPASIEIRADLMKLRFNLNQLTVCSQANADDVTSPRPGRTFWQGIRLLTAEYYPLR